ncbi:MAG: patatin-like phospholipase family protein [Woeseia sp.]
MNKEKKKPKVGVALGSGASRGWSHVGVLKALSKAGIEPSVVCGTSVGAMVGASYAAGNLEKLEEWVLDSSVTDVLSFFSFRLARPAFVDMEKFDWFLHNFVADPDRQIESLGKSYAAIAANLEDGSEVWLLKGGLADAVKASMAMPGLFPAHRREGQWLVDGGLVDPVPVSACRALGADIVIGVNLNSDILTRHSRRILGNPAVSTTKLLETFRKRAKRTADQTDLHEEDDDKPPGLFSTVSMSINIFQDQITRNRLITDPADVMIAPKVGDIGMLEFQRAADAIEEGMARTDAAMGDIIARLQDQSN